MMKYYLVLISFLIISTVSIAQRKATDIVGTWNSTGTDPGRIQIYAVGNKFFGKIIWIKNALLNGKPKLDAKNPETSKRTQGIVGLQILKDFKFDGEDEWKDGTIYDPKSGKTYNCILSLKDNNTLKLRGYIGISLFGRTETWFREK